MSKPLTEKQLKFIAAFNGNAMEAAEIAGYSNPMQAGGRLMKHADICRSIKERQIQEAQPLIASRQDRQKFWTETMYDEDLEFPHRLKASELLGKSEGDFLDRMHQTGDINWNIRWQG